MHLSPPVPARVGRTRTRVVWLLVTCGLLASAWFAGFASIVGVRAMARQLADPIILSRVEVLAPQICRAAEESGLDPNLIAAMVYSESSGRVDAVSKADALGLLQLLPPAASDAAKRLGLEPPTRVALLGDGALNLRLGASQFAWTLANEGDDVERALIAYNAGRSKLRRWIRKAGSYETWRAKQKRDGDSGVLAYAGRVLSYAEIFRQRGEITASRP
ncbi:MAG: soluble lytic murein transglycosylase-like protein [Candidatus Paceibacteria bacterium]|jgi:soluble lytic murein transglycosylase-like protein